MMWSMGCGLCGVGLFRLLFVVCLRFVVLLNSVDIGASFVCCVLVCFEGWVVLV